MKDLSRKSSHLVLLALALFSGARREGFCFADTLTGEIRGTVLDVEGRIPLAGVTGTLVSIDRGWKKQVQTDAGGNYTFLQLEPGNYTVSAEKTGYYRMERSDVLVRLNQPKVVVPPFELRKLVSTPTQQITLRGEQTKTAIIDLTAAGPTPVVLAYVREPGVTSPLSLLDATLRSNFEISLVQSLPLKEGRTFDQLALLSPGVFRVPFSQGRGPAVGIGVGSAGQFAVNGLRGRSNNFTVDGSDNNDEDIGVRRQGFVALVPQTIESVQEFQIMTAGFPPEFGRNSGSMVNAVSRSGQKDLHGAVYGFFNQDFLNARNFFEQPFADTVNGAGLNGGRFEGKDFTQRLLGGTVGGPIVPQKLFYFVSAERQQSHGISVGHFIVPTTAERGLRIRRDPGGDVYQQNGFVPVDQLMNFFQPPEGGRFISYSDLVGKGVFSLYPLPNNPLGPFGPNTYSQTKRGEANGSLFSLKTDWYPNSVHSVAARYNLTDDGSILPFTGDAINSSLGTRTRTQNISLFLNSTAPERGNALRFSYGRTRLAFPAEKSSPLLFGSAVSEEFSRRVTRPPPIIETPYGRFGPFGATGPIGQLSILPYSTIGIDVFNFPQGRVDNTFQVSDFVTRAGASHTVKVGFDVRHSQLNGFSDRNSRPLLQFGGGVVSDGCALNTQCPFAPEGRVLRGTDFASLGAPSGFLQSISTGPVPDTTIGLRFTDYDLFIQDVWKVRPTLTLNMGVRYELQTVPSEANRRIERTFGLAAGQFGHLEPGGSVDDQRVIKAGNDGFDTATAALQSLIGGRKKIYEADHNNFAPQVGLAWDPYGDGKTAIRAGYGLNYDANLGAVTSQSRNVFPSFVPLNLDPNFQPPAGIVVNSPAFFEFSPTKTPMIRPGTLNTFGIPPAALATALGTLFLQNTLGLNFGTNGLAFTLPEKNLKTSYAQHSVVSVERRIETDFLVSISYVGVRGLHLTRFSTPNGGLISTPVLFFPINSIDRTRPNQNLWIFDLSPASGKGRPEPGLGAYTLLENSASSIYHSLQVSAEKRLSRGLQLRANWTWAHAIDEVSDPFDGRGFYSLPQDSARLGLERASASFDARHRLTGFLVWEMPAIGRHALLRHWNWSTVAEFQTGQPFTVNTYLDQNRDGNLTDRLDSLNGLTIKPGDPYSIRLSPTVSLEPTISPSNQCLGDGLIACPNKNGSIARNTFRADGIATVDMALWRTFAVRDSTLILRAEAFNVFNRTHFGTPVRVLESPGFGRSFDTQINPRSVRLVVKFLF